MLLAIMLMAKITLNGTTAWFTLAHRWSLSAHVNTIGRQSPPLLRLHYAARFATIRCYIAIAAMFARYTSHLRLFATGCYHWWRAGWCHHTIPVGCWQHDETATYAVLVTTNTLSLFVATSMKLSVMFTPIHTSISIGSDTKRGQKINTRDATAERKRRRRVSVTGVIQAGEI